MKKNIITYLTACGIMATSCVSMDMVPKTQGSSESWYSTETELDMAVNEFYILGYWQEPLQSSDQWTDDFTYRNSNRGEGVFLDGTIDGQDWEIYDLWYQSYKLIARANSLLENIGRAEGNVSEDKIKVYMGEAYFARACKYMDLLFFYGDVPYVEKYMTIEEALEMGRISKDEIKPKVYDDFDKAIEYLPVSHTPASSHFTKGAAYAMKARFAMYMGDWEEMAAAAKACIDLNVYSLESDFANIFWQSTGSILEKIFSIPRSIENGVVLDQWFVNNGLPRNAGGYGSDTPSWDLFASFLCTDGLPIDESPLFDPCNPFENRDPRCAMTIVEFDTEHCGFIYNPRHNATTTINTTTGQSQTNNDCRAVAQYASYNGLLWKKGIDISWTENGKQVGTDYIIMRYADVLLMYAEAKIELGEIDDTVLDAINQVRARAYGVNVASTGDYPAVTTMDQTELRRIVRLERRMEFAKEGRRYMDLIRWKLAEKALNGYNYIMLNPTDGVDKIMNTGLWFWGAPDTNSDGEPENVIKIDEDGLADFSALYELGLCQYGARRVFPERQYLWPIPTHDNDLVNGALGNNPGY